MKDLFVEEAYYHVFNRANGNDDLFREDTNYRFFMEKYFQYTLPVAETFAFCLLKNHFHLLIKVKSFDQPDQQVALQKGNQPENSVNKAVSLQFSRLFNSYAKAYNKMYDRRGSLFQTNVKRKRINSIEHLQTLVMYIHRNPEKDGFAKRMHDWHYSSWHLYSKSTPPEWLYNLRDNVNCHEVVEWFGDHENFMQMHTGFDYQNTHSVFDVRNYGGLR